MSHARPGRRLLRVAIAIALALAGAGAALAWRRGGEDAGMAIATGRPRGARVAAAAPCALARRR